MTTQNPTLAPTALPRVSIGKTGIELPVLGFGVSGALAISNIAQRTTIELVRAAYAHGIRVFDTAPFYGGGIAEKRLAAGLEALPDNDAFISSKCGTYREAGKLKKDFSPSFIASQIEDSLTRLPRIDALFLHGPSPEHLTHELFQTLDDLKSRGKFKFLGMAGRGPEIDAALESHNFDLLMAPVNMQLTSDEIDRLTRAKAMNIGIFGIEVLKPASKGVRASIRPTDLWYSARAIFMRSALKSSSVSTQECLEWARQSGLADVILSTTTRMAHLENNIATCRTS